MNILVPWDMMPCQVVTDLRRFGAVYTLHMKGTPNISWTTLNTSISTPNAVRT